MKRILTILFASLSIFSVLQFASPAAYAQFDASKDQACKGVGVDENDAFIDCNAANSGGGVDNVLKLVLNIMSIVAGVIAVIMIIIAGIKFLTSQGDPGSVASARNTVIYAIVGIVIVALSQGIVRFVIAEVGNPPAVEQPADPCEGVPDGVDGC